ncbi:MAG: metallophosphoesterase [Lentisphaeria bacterium]
MYVSPRKKSSFWQPIFPPEEQLQHGDFIERRINLSLPGVRRSFSLLLLSDLHWTSAHPNRYQPLQESILNDPPDWLLFGGDLYFFLEFAPAAWRWLAELPAKCGKIAVRGNRESIVDWLDHDFWRRSYEKYGIRCLINEVWDTGPDGPIFFGLDDFRFGQPDWNPCRKQQNSKAPVITLSHNPDAVAEEKENFVGQLCLSGHTHGGQIRLPLLGALYTSSIYGSQFVSGWRQRNDHTLCHISSGIGESGFGIFRRRLLCPAEFTRLQITPGKTHFS